MKDTFGREITYLRVSVTELCNLRCRYCMPAEGVCKKSHEEMLTGEETANAIRAAAECGIKKVRITGGEPLVKRNIIQICSDAANTPGISEVCITTNGILLPKYAGELKKAGVSRVNISLDTLDKDRYEYITRGGNVEEAKEGLYAALDAGFERVKLNCVLIGGFNDSEIEDMAAITLKYDLDVRFIELMPMSDKEEFDRRAFVPNSIVTERCKDLVSEGEEGVAKVYRLPGAKGRIGLISPVSDHFCASCDKIRLTADGKIKPCLHSGQEINIKGLSFDDMKKAFIKAVEGKPFQHRELSYDERSQAGRDMNRIGG